MRREAGETKGRFYFALVTGFSLMKQGVALFCFGDRVFPDETRGRFFFLSLHHEKGGRGNKGSLYFALVTGFSLKQGVAFFRFIFYPFFLPVMGLFAAAQHVRADLLLTITRGTKFVQKKQTERNEYTVH